MKNNNFKFLPFIIVYIFTILIFYMKWGSTPQLYIYIVLFPIVICVFFLLFNKLKSIFNKGDSK